ncbi:MAG: hypothetical protein ACREAY_11955 [Nitrososphaera sp.]|uniref:hypothetical protein n=1 Tax=Nitrososphaera sp. TaxID=1971748 RepID=UPI003D6E22E2
MKGADGFCKELAEADEAIVAAFLISDGIQGSHLKLNVPELKEEDARRLSDQTEVIMNITRTNEQLFGRVAFVLVSHESIDGMFFPVDSSTTLLVGLVRPYDQKKIADKVSAMARSSKIWKKDTVDSI